MLLESTEENTEDIINKFVIYAIFAISCDLLQSLRSLAIFWICAIFCDLFGFNLVWYQFLAIFPLSNYLISIFLNLMVWQIDTNFLRLQLKVQIGDWCQAIEKLYCRLSRTGQSVWIYEGMVDSLKGWASTLEKHWIL